MKLKTLLTAGACTMIGLAPVAGRALPSYARQTGMACASCHFQKYPALTPFGRAFKAAGFTTMSEDAAIKGAGLSIPSVLNASLFFKIRYQLTNGTDNPGERTTNAGEVQFPDEFALFFGGRVADNVGFMLEGQLADHSAPFIAGFKIPFTFVVSGSTRTNIVPFTTDGLGAAYGFELLNTGAVRNIRVNENRNAISAQNYIKTASAAEGVAFVLVNPKWFVNVTQWSPNHFAGAGGVANGSPTATYLRAAYMPTVGNWDLGFGFQSWTGSAGTANSQGTGIDTFATKAFALDAQAQGVIGELPLGVYVSHGTSAASAAGSPKNLFNSKGRDRTATIFTAELGVLKNPNITVVGGYRVADNGGAAANSGDNALTFGANWMFKQNVQLSWTLNKFSGSAYAPGQGSMKVGGSGDMLNTLMLSAGF